MKIVKTKTTVTLITLFLMLTMSASFILLPVANAHTPPWQIPSFAYMVPAPDLIGVGQRMLIVMWVDEPLPASALTNNIRRQGFKLIITKPDGTNETMKWGVNEDPTSTFYIPYTPDQVGTYTLTFSYAGQVYTWNDTAAMRTWTNDIFLPASKTTTFTVQQEPIPEARGSYPLPTEYWTRPIEGQNTDWWSISSNWLGTPYNYGAGDQFGIPGGIQPDGIAPNSPHIMWSKPIQDGGVAGGSNLGEEGKTFYQGGSYNTRFSNALIIQGRLYYNLPYGNSGGGGGWVSVDLRTGKEIWYNQDIGRSGSDQPNIGFGYLYAYDSPNQHGILPNGLLFSNNLDASYDPRTGRRTNLNTTNIPSGTRVGGPKGELLIYVWNSTGRWLAQWNSSKMLGLGTSPVNWYSGQVDASLPSNYDWNITISGLGSGTWAINTGPVYESTNRGVAFDNLVLLRQGNFGGRGMTYGGDYFGANVTAISLKPNSRGQILWTKYYPPAPGNVTRGVAAWDTELGVFVTEDKETMVLNGFSLVNGSQLWGPTEPAHDYNYFRQTVMTAYGRLYFAGYGGVLYAYDIKTGELLWTYGNGGEGNSTKTGLGTAWGADPIFVDVIADGKIFLGTTEHSPGSPYYKDIEYRVIDAYTGEEIWTLTGWATGMDAGYDVIADGYFVFLNSYDMKVYAVGKGPSETTVTASPKVSVYGSSVLVEGTVMDIAAGTKQDEQIARFPNGVPAVSDASQSKWMEYVYMQKPRPTNATGVDVVLSVLDPNGNVYDIGTAKTDSSGTYSLMWQPPVPGKYTIIAKFIGSESYWPSYAQTAFGIMEAPAATSGPTPTPALVSEAYFVPAIAGIVVAIAIVGALQALLLLKKRP